MLWTNMQHQMDRWQPRFSNLWYLATAGTENMSYTLNFQCIELTFAPPFIEMILFLAIGNVAVNLE